MCERQADRAKSIAPIPGDSDLGVSTRKLGSLRFKFIFGCSAVRSVFNPKSDCSEKDDERPRGVERPDKDRPAGNNDHTAYEATRGVATAGDRAQRAPVSLHCRKSLHAD